MHSTQSSGGGSSEANASRPRRWPARRSLVAHSSSSLRWCSSWQAPRWPSSVTDLDGYASLLSRPLSWAGPLQEEHAAGILERVESFLPMRGWLESEGT